MITYEEARAVWGESGVVRFHPAVLQHSDLPAHSKEFLESVGFPISADFFPDLGIDPTRLPILQECLAARGAGWVRHGDRYYAVAVAGRGWVCLQKTSGAVLHVDPETEPVYCFINSRIDILAEILFVFAKNYSIAYAEFADSLEPAPGSEAVVFQFEDLIRELDPAALTDEKTWWSQYIYHMKYGAI